MALFKKKNNQIGDQATGWISMTDIYMLFSTFLLLTCVLIGVDWKSANEKYEAVITTLELDPEDQQAVKNLAEEHKKIKEEYKVLKREYQLLKESIPNDFEGWEEISKQNALLEHELEVVREKLCDLGELLEIDLESVDYKDKVRAYLAELGEESSVLRAMVASLEEQLMDLTDEHYKIVAELEKIIKEHRDNIVKAEDEIRRLQERVKLLESGIGPTIDYGKELRILEQQIRALKSQIETKNKTIARLERNVGSPGIRQELLGLGKKPIKNVVFVIDMSASMKDPITNFFDTSNRWQNTVAIISQWMSYLPIKNVGIVTFNSSSQIHFNGKFLPTTQDPNDKNRLLIISTLNGLKPRGGTDHILALTDAYSFRNIDAIILFTDGRPSAQGTKAEKYMTQNWANNQIDAVINFVEKKTKEGRNIPIHVIGVGDYFKPDMMRFFQGISKSTGGKLIGR